MNVDDLLAALREQPRPKLSPFFAARVHSHARTHTPLVVRLYWLAFACFAAYLLLPTIAFIPLCVLVTAIAVFPERLVLLGAMLLRE